jgi:murein DD-endopeptidase MepM/ murein hydrolase activator NlpD
VANAVVSETHDGIAENVPDPIARAVTMTPETLGGNSVLLDLGDGTYAFYAHLQPGSLTVKKGDSLHEGQVVGRIGNSGNSTEPHLHLHVADRNSAFDAEGIPYAFDAFDLQASSEQVTPAIMQAGNSLGLDPAAVARGIAAAPRHRRAELPLINAIVRF